DKVFAYLRETTTKKYLIVMNFSNEEQSFVLENTVKEVLIANTDVTKILQTHKLHFWSPIFYIKAIFIAFNWRDS
ncbi:Glucan 1,6-alpha-glucosidase, partial [human gut metagenome]